MRPLPLLLALIGCSPCETAWFADVDGDGHGDARSWTAACEAPAEHVPNASDCAPTEADVHPGAVERCDGRDEDCDGLVDDDPTDGVWSFPDADGDGHGDPRRGLLACDVAAGHVLDDSDCDDTDPTDWTTFYADADADGWGDAASPVLACEAAPGVAAEPGDCEDEDPGAHPEAEEICGDDTDQDCDGYGCEPNGVSSVRTAALVLSGDGAERLGVAVAGGSDLDGDGGADLVVGTGLGAVYVVPGSLTGERLASEAATVTMMGESGSEAGAALAIGDWNGDGQADLAIGGPGDDNYDRPAVWVLEGPLGPDAALTDAVWLVYGTEDEQTGASVALGDTDDDGYDDLALGSPGLANSRVTPGTITLARGGRPGEMAFSDGDLVITGTDDDGMLGTSVVLADLNGDARAEILAISYEDGGTIHVFDGSTDGSILSTDADARILAPSCGDWGCGWAALAAVGDLDGDGYGELGGGTGDGGDRHGAAYVFTAPSGDVDSTAAYASVYGTTYRDEVGWGLAGPGDLDGDGNDDLVIGAGLLMSGARGAGLVVYGPVEGSRSWAEADAILLGEPGDMVSLVAPAGDANGDGYADLLLAEALSRRYDGAVWLVAGGGL